MDSIPQINDDISLDEAIKYCHLNNSNEVSIREYLDDLIYETNEPISYLPLFGKQLEDERFDIKAKCIEAILFVLHIQDEIFKKSALKYLSEATSIDTSEPDNFNLKIWCASGLGEAYFGTQDVECLVGCYNVLKNVDEEVEIRVACFKALLKIYFSLSTQDIFSKCGISPELTDIKDQYNNEWQTITELYLKISKTSA